MILTLKYTPFKVVQRNGNNCTLNKTMMVLLFLFFFVINQNIKYNNKELSINEKRYFV